MSDKITAKHLERGAYVYIRQSTLHQVRNNLESGRLQYALKDRARELGFKSVVIVDEDLGISGAGNRERPGFGRLLAAVCNGEVGAVFALEASRLARNNRDWHEWPLVKASIIAGSAFPITTAVGDFDEPPAGLVEQRIRFGAAFDGAWLPSIRSARNQIPRQVD